MLLERAAQLDLLVGLLQAAHAGGHVVLVSGEAGAGKTALVAEFCATAEPGEVLVGRCDDLFAPRPLGPLVDIAREVGGELKRALEDGDQQAAFEAFLDVVSAGPQPTTVVLDDLQWADDATLDLLRFVTRRLDRTRCLIIATYRDDVSNDHPLRQALAGITGAKVHRMPLPPLSLDAVRTMASGRAIDADALHTATAGNPFYVVEVLAAERWTIPTSVRDVVLARAARLDRSAREALEATAVLGGLAHPETVMNVAECPEEALEACIAAGLLNHLGTQVAFRHDLSRAAIEEAIPPWRHRAYHARALEALATSDDVVALAHHAIGAGDGEVICRIVPAAAQRCSALGANRAAAALYANAVQHADLLPEPDSTALYEAHARACACVGDEPGSQHSGEIVLQRLRDVGDPVRLGVWLSWLSSVGGCSSTYADSARAQRLEAVELLTPLGDSIELANALASLAGQSMLLGPTSVAVEAASRSFELAERFGDEALAMRMLSCWGIVLAVAGDQRGFDLLHQSLKRGQAADDPLAMTRAHNNLGSTFNCMWRPADALPHIEQALRLAHQNEIAFRPAFVLEERTHTELLLGEWDTAITTATDVLSDLDIADLSRLLTESHIALIQNRRGRCKNGAPLSVDPPPPGLDELQLVHPVRIARAEGSWFAGDIDAARREIIELVPVHRNFDEPYRLGELALWCRRTGVDLPVERPIAKPFELHLAGRVREAATIWAERRCPYHQADALGDSDDEADLRASLEILHQLGADGRAQQVARRMRQLGMRTIPRGPRATTRSHAAGLTIREVEVAGMLADGLTNAQIAERLVVSPKTVDHHVSAVLAKLGVASRRHVSSALVAR